MDLLGAPRFTYFGNTEFLQYGLKEQHIIFINPVLKIRQKTSNLANVVL